MPATASSSETPVTASAAKPRIVLNTISKTRVPVAEDEGEQEDAPAAKPTRKAAAKGKKGKKGVKGKKGKGVLSEETVVGSGSEYDDEV